MEFIMTLSVWVILFCLVMLVYRVIKKRRKKPIVQVLSLAFIILFAASAVQGALMTPEEKAEQQNQIIQNTAPAKPLEKVSEIKSKVETPLPSKTNINALNVEKSDDTAAAKNYFKNKLPNNDIDIDMSIDTKDLIVRIGIDNAPDMEAAKIKVQNILDSFTDAPTSIGEYEFTVTSKGKFLGMITKERNSDKFSLTTADGVTTEL